MTLFKTIKNEKHIITGNLIQWKQYHTVFTVVSLLFVDIILKIEYKYVGKQHLSVSFYNNKNVLIR